RRADHRVRLGQAARRVRRDPGREQPVRVAQPENQGVMTVPEPLPETPSPRMPARRPAPDAREVDRIEAVVTVNDPERVDEFLHRCSPRSSWMVRIRTAELLAT